MKWILCWLALGMSFNALAASYPHPPADAAGTLTTLCTFEMEDYKVELWVKTTPKQVDGQASADVVTTLRINGELIPAMQPKCVVVPRRGIGGSGFLCAHHKETFRVDLYPDFPPKKYDRPLRVRGIAYDDNVTELFPQLDCKR